MRRTRSELVRNPMLALPAVDQLLALPRKDQLVIRAICLDLASDSAARAEKCWRTHKAPMAAYWKAVAVYAGHLAKAIGAPRKRLREVDVDDFDPENIYNLPSIRQSIEEDRK